jgi:hypothetical protein
MQKSERLSKKILSPFTHSKEVKSERTKLKSKTFPVDQRADNLAAQSAKQGV